MCQIFLNQIVFYSSRLVEFDFLGFVTRICLNVQSQGTKNLRCETLHTDDYEYVNIFNFVVLRMKLWLEEDVDLNRNDRLYSFKFI